LDPFEQHDDATLNNALRAAGLFSLQSETDEGRITLDTAISSSGCNLSVGQRQILALARALVRGSKLFVLDEGESSLLLVSRANTRATATSAIGNSCSVYVTSLSQTAARLQDGFDYTIISPHRAT